MREELTTNAHQRQTCIAAGHNSRPGERIRTRSRLKALCDLANLLFVNVNLHRALVELIGQNANVEAPEQTFDDRAGEQCRKRLIVTAILPRKRKVNSLRTASDSTSSAYFKNSLRVLLQKRREVLNILERNSLFLESEHASDGQKIDETETAALPAKGISRRTSNAHVSEESELRENETPRWKKLLEQRAHLRNGILCIDHKFLEPSAVKEAVLKPLRFISFGPRRTLLDLQAGISQHSYRTSVNKKSALRC